MANSMPERHAWAASGWATARTRTSYAAVHGHAQPTVIVLTPRLHDCAADDGVRTSEFAKPAALVEVSTDSEAGRRAELTV